MALTLHCPFLEMNAPGAVNYKRQCLYGGGISLHEDTSYYTYIPVDTIYERMASVFLKVEDLIIDWEVWVKSFHQQELYKDRELLRVYWFSSNIGQFTQEIKCL